MLLTLNFVLRSFENGLKHTNTQRNFYSHKLWLLLDVKYELIAILSILVIAYIFFCYVSQMLTTRRLQWIWWWRTKVSNKRRSLNKTATTTSTKKLKKKLGKALISEHFNDINLFRLLLLHHLFHLQCTFWLLQFISYQIYCMNH